MATTTWTQTAGMVSDEDTDNLESFSEQAEASKNAAAASEAAAEASATSASASATSATSSASSASTDAATATTKASEAATSATNAATSETNAATSATNAATSETNAATSATNAATSETNAATSATSAAASAASVGSEASDAAASATAAAASETAAATSETNAATSATNAATSETNAATSATTASTAATNASTSETNAATSETNAATSETNAATSETNAATSATSASTSATNAATSASAASASQVSAAASAASAANSYDLFDDRYLGTKTSDPTVDNDGNALVAGALYFNSSANEMRVYDGANWIAASSAGGASLLEYKYTATSGQTTFSGADDNSNSLSYTQDNLIVTLNGVVLENGTDYTATTGTSVVLASGAATSDELNVIAFKTFTTADMVAASTGGTFYGNVAMDANLTFGDNDKAIFGAGSDLQIYHDGSSSIIQDNGTGHLRLHAGSLRIRNSANTEALISADEDGAVELFYNGSEKLATTNTGVDITGTLTSDGLTVSQGSGANILLESTTTSATTGDIFGEIEFKTNDSNSSGIKGKIDSYSEGAVGNGALRLFTGDTTGLYQRMNIASNGDISFYEDTGTTPKFFWDASAESLGIGTSSPTEDLHVSGTADQTIAVESTSTGAGANAGIKILAADGGDFLWQTGNATGNALRLYDLNASQERMRIDSSGNLLVGLTSGSSKLHVNSEISVGADGDNRSMFGYTSGRFYLGTRQSGTNYFDTISVTSGNVGINNTSPNTKLDIIGSSTNGSGVVDTLRLRNTGATINDGPRLQFTSGTSTSGAAIASLGKALNSADLVFYAGGNTERMRIASTGELLVGTTSDTMPAAAAAGQAIMAGTRAFIATETGGDTILGGTTGSNFTAFYQGGTERMRIDISGNLLVGKSSASNDVTTAGQLFFPAGKSVITNNGDAAQNLVLAHYNSTGSPIAIEFYRNSTVVGNITKSSSGTTYNTTSDRRLKDNIEPIADGTEKLMAMKPVTHTWKADPNTGETVHGFIAQEMQEIVPEAVSGDPDGEEMMSMDYGRITPVLVAALQDAHKKIEALEERLAELEAK